MKKENLTWKEKFEERYKERQEMVRGMFLHREWENPADYYLRPTDGISKEILAKRGLLRCLDYYLI